MSGDIASLYIKVDSKGVVTASKDLDELTGKAQKTEDSTRKVTRATDSANASFMSMANAVKALAVSYGALKVLQYAKEATMLAARYETLGVVMRVVGNNAGYTGAQMEAYAKSLEKAGISMIEARQTLTRMVQANLDLAQSSKLARVAQDAAVIGNINSSEAFQRMVYGIQSGHALILRTIGINVNFENSYQKVAKATGRVTAQLSEAEKSQIRMNAVMDAGKMIAGTYEAAMGTAGKQVLSLQRHLDNLKVAFGLAFTPALAELIEQVTGAVTDLNGELSGNSKDKITEWGTNFRIAIISVEAEIRRLAMLLDKLGGTMTSAQMLLYGPGKALGVKSSTERFDRAAAANMEYEARYKANEAALEALAKKQIELERSLTAEGKAAAKAKADAVESKVLAAQKATTATEKVVEADEKAIKAAQKLREEADKINETLGNDIKMSGLDELEKKLFEIQLKYEKLAKNPLVDKGLLSTARGNEESSARWEARSQELKKEAELTQEITKAEEELIKTIQAGYDATMDGIQKQYDADGQLLRDKLELYKDLTGFEDEYRQVQLDWIERIKKEEIKATGDVAAAEKKAAKERAQIEYNLFKTKTDYIADGFGQLQSAFSDIASVYEKGSDAARQWETAAKAMEIAQKAVAVVQAVGAIATQGLGDPYTAFARIAAMAATMGALLATIGKSVGGAGRAGVASAPQYAFSNSVLGGEAGELSESLKKSWEFLEDTYEMEYEKLTKIYNELKNLNSNITGLVTSIVRPGGVSYATIATGDFKSSTAQFIEDKFDNLVGLITDPARAIGLGFLDPLGKWLSGVVGGWVSSAWNSIFGGNMTRTITGQGIQLSIPSVSAMLAGSYVGARSYTSIHENEEGGWFHSDKNKYYSLYGEVSAQVTDLFASVFTNISGTLVELAKGLGQDVNAALGYFFGPIEINLQGMNAEQINKAILEHVSAMSDAAVDALFGQLLKGYQELGESLTTTAVRLMVDKEIVLEVLEQTRQSYTSTVEDTIAFSEALIKLAGDLETLTDVTSKYYKSFMTEEEKQIDLQEQLTITLGDFNAILPATRNAYRSLVEGLDLTTDHGRYAYITLLKLAETADGYYSYLEDLANTRFEFENELLELQGKAEEALARERQKELDAMDSTLRPLQQLVWLTQDWAEKISQANSEAADAISQQISLASSAASASRSAANEYRNIIKSLTDAQESIRGGGAAETQRFESLFAVAMTGDREALSALPGAADKLLSGSLATSKSAVDYARDQGKMLLALEQAKTVSGEMASWNEYHATLLETQVNVLEEIRDELAQENPDLALLEQHAGLLEDIATLLGGQTSEIITGNAIQDVIANLSSLDTSYSAEMLNALVSREMSQGASLESILTANTTTVSLLRQLVDLTTNSVMEMALAEIKSSYSAIQDATTNLQKTMTNNYNATQALATAQAVASAPQFTLADVLAKNAGTAYSAANAPAQYGTYTLSSDRMSKESLITNLFNAGLGSVITQKESSYIATNYNDLWESYGHYYLDENGILRSAPGGNYHADLGAGWSTGGPTSSAYITAGVQASYAANEAAKQAAVASALAATQQAMKDVEAANQKLSAAQSEYSALVAQYESTFGSAPAFASGGPFSGGLRIVGENGPELEYTGPSHIVNASKTEAFMSSNAALLAEIKKLNAKIDRLEAISYQTTKNTQKTAKTLEKFDYDGLPDTRVA